MLEELLKKWRQSVPQHVCSSLSNRKYNRIACLFRERKKFARVQIIRIFD